MNAVAESPTPTQSPVTPILSSNLIIMSSFFFYPQISALFPFPLKLGPKFNLTERPETWRWVFACVFLSVCDITPPVQRSPKAPQILRIVFSAGLSPRLMRFHSQHHHWPTADSKYWCVSWLWAEGSKSCEIRWNAKAPGSYAVRRKMFLWNFWLNKCSIFHLPLTQHIFLLSTFVWIGEKKVRINVEQDIFRHHSQRGGARRHTAAVHDKKGSLASFL